MSRPTDWSAAGWDRDPVPGDSAAVAGAAAKYRKTAEAVGTAIANLDRVDAANMTGQAITAVLDRIKTVRGQLDSVEGRVAGAASALEGYHPELAAAQSESLAALHEAEVHRSAERHAARVANDAANRHNLSHDPVEKADAKADYDRACGDLDRASHDLSAARARIQRAIDQRDEAAKSAVNQLSAIEDQSPVKDTWWDKFSDACGKAADWIEKNLKPLLDKLAKVLDIASIVCTVLGVILSFTPLAGVGFALLGAANVIGMVSMGLAAFSTVIVGFMKAAGGRQSWGAYLGSVALFAGTMVAKRFLKKGFKEGAFAGLTKIAKVAKTGVIRSVVTKICNNEIKLTPLIKLGASKAAGAVVSGVKAAGSWAYENLVKPVSTPQQMPQRYVRHETCGGGSGGRGFAGAGGSGGSIGGW